MCFIIENHKGHKLASWACQGIECLSSPRNISMTSHRVPGMWLLPSVHKTDKRSSLAKSAWYICIKCVFQLLLHSLFFFLKKNLLEDSCFTKLCWFLPDINMNQRQVHTHPLPLNLPPTAHRTPPPRLSQSTGLSSLHHTANPTSCLSYIRWCKCFYAALSIRPTLSLPSTVSTNLFSVSASPLPPCM